MCAYLGFFELQSSRGSREKTLGVVITYNGILSTAEHPPTRRPVIMLSTLLDAAVKPACTSLSQAQPAQGQGGSSASTRANAAAAGAAGAKFGRAL